ncbi:MAG: protein kinase domain-containing protein, partial [Terriglobales bacterium]
GRDVAVKVLPAAFAMDAERLARFQREARIIAALSHPNILAVYDVGADEGQHYLVSELVEGASLRARLAEDPPPARKAVEYAVQIAQGLAAAHEKGVIHRDLKPDNLLLSKDGRVKILDFGLALVGPTAASGDDLTSPTAAGMVLGTVGYMSPEQVRGQPVDHRSDIFSFGAVLYEMLTGQRAFRRDTSAETMTSILKEEPPEVSASGKPVPPGLDRIVRHCLEKNPEERFQSASDLAFDLASLSSSSTTSAQAVRAPVGRRAVTAALAVAALAAIAALSFAAGKHSVPLAGQPRFQRLTFRDGYISAARFAPDSQTVVYSAQWDNGPTEIFTTRLEFPESRPLGLKESVVYAVSGSGDMLIAQRAAVYRYGIHSGTLSLVPLAGGSPRELVPDVGGADVGGGAGSFAVVKDLGNRYQLEFPAGKLLFETSGYISHARVSPDGQQVAFMEHPVRNDDRGWVSVVDRGGNRKKLTPEWAGSQQGLAWHPSGKEIWFTASELGPSMSLRAVTLEGQERVVLRTAGRLKLHDIAPDGRVLLTREAWRNRVVAHTDGQSRPLDLTWLDGTGVSDISRDGSTILCDEWSAAAGPMYAACMRKLDSSPPVRLGEGAG